MRVLLEIEHFCLLFFKFTAGLIRIRVLFEGRSLSRIYGFSDFMSACASVKKHKKSIHSDQKEGKNSETNVHTGN